MSDRGGAHGRLLLGSLMGLMGGLFSGGRIVAPGNSETCPPPSPERTETPPGRHSNFLKRREKKNWAQRRKHLNRIARLSRRVNRQRGAR